MSGYTQNLELFKYNTSTDGLLKFNIDSALNDNFDKIDTFAGTVNNSLNNKQNKNTAVTHPLNVAVGTTTTPVFVDSEGNVVECSNSIENTRFNGQWVIKNESLSTATSAGTRPLNFSSYLPNDNHSYEIIFSASGASGGNNYPSATITEFNLIVLRAGVNYKDVWNYESNSFILPVTNSRSLTLTLSAGFHNFNLSALAYRRIGTNL